MIFLMTAIPFATLVVVWDYKEWKKKKELLQQIKNKQEDVEKQIHTKT